MKDEVLARISIVNTIDWKVYGRFNTQMEIIILLSLILEEVISIF